MKKVIVTDDFWELFPEGAISLLVIRDLDNHVNDKDIPYFTSLLAEGAQNASKFLKEETFSENTVVQEWRDAYRQFKTKKGARSSIEALLKRASQGRTFSPINPLVDIYNSVSLSHGVPCGGEDIEKINGNMYLGKAKGGESFFPLGAEKDDPALPDEMMFYDSDGAICRNLNWREAQRTMLTEETKNAVMVSESVSQDQAAKSLAAINDLKEQVDTYFKTTSTIYVLTKDSPEVIIA